MTTDDRTRHARAHELLDLLLSTVDRDNASAEVVDYDAMADEELLKSDVGTRVREILFHQLKVQGQDFYDNARLKGTGSAMLAGIGVARDWIYPEDIWACGFRDAAEWDLGPYKPTEEDRAELMRRIAAKDYKVDRDQVEQMAMDIAEANGWGAEEPTP
ncbi:hypothetical protein AB0E08_07635 [Streptomyces sp. NPDC048281]|uniref:hypothetical protein n=1 Tax=Streptomyces sp. NPDC048281 TaxID=3154715 RepID=UPI003434BF8F